MAKRIIIITGIGSGLTHVAKQHVAKEYARIHGKGLVVNQQLPKADPKQEIYHLNRLPDCERYVRDIRPKNPKEIFRQGKRKRSY